MTLGGMQAQVLVRTGIGSLLPVASGRHLLVFSSPQTSGLEQVFAPIAARLAGARAFDPAFRYPVFHDKFGGSGIGSWYPPYWDGRFARGKPDGVDDHLDFARRMGLAIQPTGGDFLLRNLLPKFREYGIPYHFAQWQEWSPELARMAPEELVSPGSGFSTMPHYYGQISDGGQRLLQYRNWSFQEVVREHVADPLLVDWLDPNGELGPHPIYAYWDFSEANRRNLVRYLREQRGYTTASLGEAWYGDRSRFAIWDAVPIPMGWDLFGFAAGDIPAERSWRIHRAEGELKARGGYEKWTEKVNDAPAYLGNGLAKGWQRPDFDDAPWAQVERPGGELASISWDLDGGWGKKFYWRRGAVEVPAAWLEGARRDGRVYLSIAAQGLSLGWKEPDRLWVNGTETACISACFGNQVTTQVDVTALLKPGRNHLVLLANTGVYAVDGPIFLTTRPPESYPFSDPRRNARHCDWKDYITWCVSDRMEKTLQAIRGVDPERFIKVHAAKSKDTTMPTTLRYGGYQHFTGEGSYFHPWDKRFGYVYGVPASAEFGGSIVEAEAWKRWLGWFSFEGVNALDNFHNLQDIMYSPVAPLWERYLPYIKAANHRELRRPGLALFWSSRNNDLLARPVPYCFDLGRGDLQGLGFSNVYVDEAGAAQDLLRDYPVVWDCGTWVMDAATVAGLRRYVEAGGTFIALHETGRHSPLHRDAWPIAELGGFRAGPERPMAGQVSILSDQGLLRRLAGRNFYNRGRSVDYSDYNYADRCFALEPVAEGATAIARYDDGRIAIGLRQLGKGRVITLGSPFWRDSHDQGGMWWPGPGQSDFVEDLLGGLGVQPVATSDSREIWREHYLATNGTEEHLVLFNPGDGPRTCSIAWRTLRPAIGLYDPKDGQAVAGTIDGGTVKLERITLDALETRIIAASSQRPASAAVDDWFRQLARWWRPSAPGRILTRPDLPCYDLQLGASLAGKVVAAASLAALDPAALSRRSDPGPGFERGAGQSIEEFRARPDPQRRVLLHCPLSLPASWGPADTIRLSVGASRAPGAAAEDEIAEVWLNGEQVAARGAGRGLNVEIGRRLVFGGANALCLVAGPRGFVGEVVLRRRPPVAETIEVAGSFQVQLGPDSGTGRAEVPGVVAGLYAWKDDVAVPAAWQGARIFLQLEVADLGEYDSFAINDKVIFHPVGWGTNQPVTWMDITPWVRCGGANRITLISRNCTHGWQAGRPEYRSIRLQRVDPGRN